MKKPVFILLVTLFLPSCIHTSKISNLYNYGARMKPSDVILFTGFNNEQSKMSEQMQKDTEQLLGQCGIKTLYLHKEDFNYEFIRAGFEASEVDVDNDDFIYKMKEVYGLNYIFSVGDALDYGGDTMQPDDTDLDDASRIIFEVYSLEDEKVLSSMRIAGNSHYLTRFPPDAFRNYGNVHKNYRKGLRKLMKSANCE